MIVNADNTPILTEEQPENFKCAVRFKPQAIFLYSVKALILIVESLATLAVREFDSRLPRFGYEDEGMAIRLSSSRARGNEGYRVKEMMWSIRRVFGFFDDEDRYAEVVFTTAYEIQPTIGNGDLVSLPSTSHLGTVNASALAVTGNASPGSEEDELVSTSPLRLATGNKSASASKDAGNYSSLGDDSITVGRFRSISTEPEYKPPDIYALIIDTIMAAAQATQSEFEDLSAYNVRADVSLVVLPTSRHAEDIPYNTAIIALADLGNKLAFLEPQYRWRPVSFLIFNHARTVGRGFMQPGRIGNADELVLAAGNGTEISATAIS